MATALSEYVSLHYVPERPGLSADYARLLRRTVQRLENHAGQALALADVDRGLLASFVQRGIDSGLRPSTVNGWAQMIRTILLAAYDDGLLAAPPRRVRRLPENLPPPEAWTFEECQSLFATIRALPGWVNGIPAPDFWTGLAGTVYWTACRIGALMRCEWPDYRPGEGLLVRKQKNGRQQWYALPVTACQAIERLWRKKPGRIFDWPFHRSTLFTHFRPIVEAAGLPAPRRARNLFHRLRRTNVTYCAMESHALAQRQADHTDWRTTAEHYVDPRLLRERSAADVLRDPTLQNPPTPGPATPPPHLRIVG